MPVTTFKSKEELAAACREGFRPFHVEEKADGTVVASGYWEV